MRVGNFLKKSLENLKKDNIPKIDIIAIQGQIGDSIFGLLDSTFADRLSNVENSFLTKDDLDQMASKYVKQNMAIAMASGLVPGPLGIFAAIPELVLTMKNQMSMVYDFSCGFDKESFLSKDILLDIPIFALGGKTDLAAIQNASNLMDSPILVLKGKALDLGKAVVERNLKKSLVKFIPVGGGLIMATWAKMSTQKVASASKTFFDDGLNFVDKKEELSREVEEALVREKIKAMINLMEADGDIHENELSFIAPIISEVNISTEQKAYLLEEAEKVGSEMQVEFDLFKKHPDEAEELIMELSLLTKRDGVVHPEQRNYLLKVADEVNYSRDGVEEILAM